MKTSGIAPRAALASVLLVTLSSWSAACGEAPSGRDRVTAIVTPYLAAMPFYIAQHEGYFTEQGLDVEFRRVTRVQDVMAAA